MINYNASSSFSRVYTTPHKKLLPNTPSNGNNLPLPDDRRMDWTALVDTATKAIHATSEEEEEEVEEQQPQKQQRKVSKKSTVLLNNTVSSTVDVDRLLERVNLLETRLNSEAAEKSQLASEVAALREENLRLQEESQTASQQLKRFTEWFFQTIDKT